MEVVDLSKYLVWLVPNFESKDMGIELQLYGKEYILGEKDHREFCEEFIKEHKLDHKGRGGSHLDYARTFCENGFLVGFFSGAPMNHKYYGNIFLPEEMNDYQMEFMESQRKIFAEEFYSETNYFSVLVYSQEELPYRSPYPGFRSLEIEAMIDRNPNGKNGQILLFEELERMKQKKMRLK